MVGMPLNSNRYYQCQGVEILEVGEIKHISQDINHLRQSFNKCAFTWVHRSGNMLAHTIANLFSRDLLSTNWRWSPPRVVKEIMDKEKGCLTSYTRSALQYQRRTSQNEGEGITLPVLDMASSSATPSCVELRSFPPDPGIIWYGYCREFFLVCHYSWVKTLGVDVLAAVMYEWPNV